MSLTARLKRRLVYNENAQGSSESPKLQFKTNLMSSHPYRDPFSTEET